MTYRVLILLLIMGCSMDLLPDNGITGKIDFIYSALEIIDRIFSVLDGGGKYSARKKRQTGAILVVLFVYVFARRATVYSLLHQAPEGLCYRPGIKSIKGSYNILDLCSIAFLCPLNEFISASVELKLKIG